MRVKTLIWGLVIILTSCSGEKQHKVDLQIPDEVVINKDGKHQQFSGTRVFIVNPEGYLPLNSLIRFQKNDDTYIQAFEFSNTSFFDKKADIIQALEDAKSKKLHAPYQKEFKLGDYDAFFGLGTDENPQLAQMALVFGDEDFCVMVVGILPKYDDKARKEVLSALLTTYLDKSVEPDYSDLASFTLDVSNSDFKFNSNMSQFFYYTVNGKGDPVNNEFENLIAVMTTSTMKDLDERKEFSQSVFQNHKDKGVDFSTVEDKELKINDVSAYEITASGKYKGKSVQLYQVVLGDNKTTILFLGLIYDQQNELFKQCENVAQTLRIK